VAEGYLLDAHFTRSFYKHMLGVPVTFHDMEALDPQFYRSLLDVLRFPLEDLGLELTFTMDTDEFGVHRAVELVPGGASVAVTDANKREYVRLVTLHKLTLAIQPQIDAFLTGFHDLVPPDLVSIFSDSELELLISGLPTIDIDDLAANTEYHGYRPDEPVIQWLWAALREMSDQDKARFLMFVTGTSKVPLEGFKALQGMRGPQKFIVQRALGKGDNTLPVSHTCFVQLDLPPYSSADVLRQRIGTAVREGCEGFGFA
jgi:E3 ubiquitin-protein ligase HUWE1